MELQEQPLRPAVVLRVGGVEGARPVEGRGVLLARLDRLGDVGARVGVGVLVVADRGVLRRQAEGVEAHRVQHLVAALPPVARHHVVQREHLGVTHVQVAARVGEHRQRVALLARAVVVGAEGLAAPPTPAATSPRWPRCRTSPARRSRRGAPVSCSWRVLLLLAAGLAGVRVLGMKKPLTWRGGRVSVLVEGWGAISAAAEEGGSAAPAQHTRSMAADLSRYADWLDFLTALPRRVPAAAGGRGQRVRGHRRLGRALRPRCRGLVQRRRRDDVRRRAGAGACTSFDVDHVWELPEATWPTGRQCFIHLQPDAADLSRPTRLLDLVIQTTPERLTMDTRRHGAPIVLHDPAGLLVLEDDDEAELAAQRRQAVAQTAARRQTAAWLVERAIARGDLAEATALHLRFAVEPLVRLLRIQHCPARLRLRPALPAHRPASPGWPSGWRRCCPGRTWRSGPGQRSRGRTRSWLSSRPSAGHLTKRGVNGGFHHSPL